MCEASDCRGFSEEHDLILESPISRLLHELNNPLTNVLLLVTQMHREMGVLTAETGNPRAERMLASCGVLRDAVDHLQCVVRGVGELAGGGASFSLLDVGECLRLPLELTEHALAGKGRMICELDKVPPVWGNQTRISQIFLNLLSNAVQALPKGNVDRNHVRVSVRADADSHVVVEIADTGIGIAPDAMQHIFEPYFTTRATRGTGLGLAIARAFVLELGGALDVESVRGQGTTFRVTLPAVAGNRRP